jgi:hypothetical protein
MPIEELRTNLDQAATLRDVTEVVNFVGMVLGLQAARARGSATACEVGALAANVVATEVNTTEPLETQANAITISLMELTFSVILALAE